MNVATVAPSEDPGPPPSTLAAWLDAIEEGMSEGAYLATRRERARAVYDCVRPLIELLLRRSQT